MTEAEKQGTGEHPMDLAESIQSDLEWIAREATVAIEDGREVRMKTSWRELRLPTEEGDLQQYGTGDLELVMRIEMPKPEGSTPCSPGVDELLVDLYLSMSGEEESNDPLWRSLRAAVDLSESADKTTSPT